MIPDKRMKKKKKKFNRRINPEKSNKMIWAVSIGLLIIVMILFFTFTGGDSVSNRQEFFDNTLKYLKRTEGITTIESSPDTSSVKIFFEPDPNSRAGIDYKKAAIYAGIKLSNKLKGEKLVFRLIKDPGKTTELLFIVQDGKIINDTP